MVGKLAYKWKCVNECFITWKGSMNFILIYAILFVQSKDVNCNLYPVRQKEVTVYSK